MLFRVDIAMAATEITLSKYVKKEIARIGLKLDCTSFYLHKLIGYRKMIRHDSLSVYLYKRLSFQYDCAVSEKNLLKRVRLSFLLTPPSISMRLST
jgi:hypothetical protein